MIVEYYEYEYRDLTEATSIFYDLVASKFFNFLFPGIFPEEVHVRLLRNDKLEMAYRNNFTSAEILSAEHVIGIGESNDLLSQRLAKLDSQIHKMKGIEALAAMTIFLGICTPKHEHIGFSNSTDNYKAMLIRVPPCRSPFSSISSNYANDKTISSNLYSAFGEDGKKINAIFNTSEFNLALDKIVAELNPTIIDSLLGMALSDFTSLCQDELKPVCPPGYHQRLEAYTQQIKEILIRNRNTIANIRESSMHNRDNIANTEEASIHNGDNNITNTEEASWLPYVVGAAVTAAIAIVIGVIIYKTHSKQKGMNVNGNFSPPFSPPATQGTKPYFTPIKQPSSSPSLSAIKL